MSGLHAIPGQVFRLIQSLRVFFHAVGLGILTVVRRQEPPKILIYTSKRQALFHSVTHILPSLVSLTLIAFNLKGFFIGRELQGKQGLDGLKLGVIQIAAKIQELLIVSSITNVVFRLLRSQLIAGEGVPLGHLGAGFAFSQASFFWSTEFWGGIISREPRSSHWTPRIFIITIAVGGLLALMAGPATAVLMIPRVLDWPVGGGVFWLNGSDSQLWPEYVDRQYLADWDCSSNEARLFDPKCPSSGFLPIHGHFYTWWNVPQGYPILTELQDYSIRKVVYGRSSHNPSTLTSSYTTHLATAMLQDAMRDEYLSALEYLKHTQQYDPPGPNYLDVAESMRFEVDTRIPTARTSCVVNSNVTIEEQTMWLNFSTPVAGQDMDYSVIQYMLLNIDVASIVQRYLLGRGVLEISGGEFAFAGPTPTILAIPIVLAEDKTKALGLVILKNTGAGPWAASTCTVHARWEPAVSIIESTEDDNRLSHEHWADRIVNVVRTKTSDNDAAVAKESKIIHIDLSWYELLSPIVSDAAIFGQEVLEPSPERSMIERLLEVMMLPSRIPRKRGNAPGDNNEVRGVEHMLATYFADGLSRCGAHLHPEASQLLGSWQFGDWKVRNKTVAQSMVHRGSPRIVFEVPELLVAGGWNSTRMEMRAIFTGYVIAAVDWFDYLSIGLLLLHIVVAFAHTGRVLMLCQTSEAWDSVPELIALSQMSSPPTGGQLASSCAGIRTLGTMGRVAIVEASSTSVGSLRDVQLRFRDPARPRDVSVVPEPGKEYG